MKKKWLKIVLVLLLSLMTIFVSGMFWLTRGLTEGENLSVGTVDLNNIDNGIYYGQLKMGRWSNQLYVTVENHQITNIEVKKRVSIDSEELRISLFESVIRSQSLQVDAVSEATITSNAYLKSIENALSINR